MGYNKIDILKIDHIVSNHIKGNMELTVKYYEDILDFHRYWSVDDKIIHTKYSSLNSIVVSDFDNNIKMPINEPALGLKKSQIQEYCDYYNGSGVQHIAFFTNDICNVVRKLKMRGVDFLDIPNSYYDNLKKNLYNKNDTNNNDNNDENNKDEY